MRKFYVKGTWFNRGIADLIAKLKEPGAFESTLFVSWVDNGYSVGHLAKNSPFEKGLRTPMFLSWAANPGFIPAGRRKNSLHYSLALHATVLDYAGFEPTQEVQSQSLRPFIDGRSIKPARKTLHGGIFATTTGDTGEKRKGLPPVIFSPFMKGYKNENLFYITQKFGDKQPERYWGPGRGHAHMITRPLDRKYRPF